MTNDELDEWVLEAMRSIGADTISVIYGEVRTRHHEETAPYVGGSRFSNMIVESLTRLADAHWIQVWHEPGVFDPHMAIRVRRLSLLETLAWAAQ